jgi:hypothetical protein
VLADGGAVERQAVRAGLPLDGVVAVAGIPLEDVVAGTQQRDIVARLAINEVVPSPPSSRSAPFEPPIVSLPVPPSAVRTMSGARLPVVDSVSSPLGSAPRRSRGPACSSCA